jgi:hypothetical protein
MKNSNSTIRKFTNPISRETYYSTNKENTSILKLFSNASINNIKNKDKIYSKSKMLVHISIALFFLICLLIGIGLGKIVNYFS